MKKAIRILLAILLICLAALTVVACKPDDPVIDPQEQCKQNGHSWEMSAKYPTCDAEGKITYTCTVCGATDERVLPPTGNHSWDAGKETTPPTCGVEGVRTYTCTECGETRTEAIPATGKHKLGEHFVEVASTCEREGSREYWLCQDCGNKVDQDGNAVSDDALVIPKLSHVYEVTDVTEPTCEETGKITYTCTVCGKASFDKEIPATGHSYGRLVDGTEATCTTPGMQAYYHCDRCGKYFDADKRQTEYDDLVIDKLQHRWVEVEGKQATCTEEGLTDGVVCEQCGVWQQPQTSIPAKGHNEQPIPAVAATCTEGGLTEGVRCADCGKILVYPKHTAALGHSYVVDVSVGDEGWIWGDDFLSATLNFVCANVGCPQPHVSVDAEVEVSSDDPDHTAYKATARYQGNTYTKEHSVNHNHTEHTYTVVEWRWDGYTSASVVLRCTVGNEQQTVAAEVTKEETRRPTCAVEGLNTYTATAQGPDGKTYTDVKQETVAVTSHNYVITHEGDAFGQHHEQCSVCGDDKQPVSCTIVENHCTVCDYTYTDDEILTALFALAQKTELPGTYKLSGTVTKMVSIRNTSKNQDVIFNMQVGGRIIYVYHAVGEGFDKVAVGSQVTIVGSMDCKSEDQYRFYDCTLTIDHSPTLTIDSSITNGKFVGLPDSVVGRTTVRFSITPDDGYYVESVKVNGETFDPVDGIYTIDVYQDTVIEVTIVEGTQQSVDYVKLTSQDLLQEGLQFIIVASDYDFAMKPRQGNETKLKGITITKNDDVITVVGDSVQVVVLEKGSLTDTWALRVGNAYLCASGMKDDKNQLTTVTSKEENGASWKITIAPDGVATIVAQPKTSDIVSRRNNLKFNSSSELFNCYNSGQSSVTLYYKPGHIHKWVYKTLGSDWQHTKQCSECQESVTEPCSPVLNACACGKTYTAQEIVDKLYTLDPGEELPGTYELTGKVTKVSEQYNTQYKNSTFYMNVCGKDVQVYHVTGDATLLQSVKVGYTITVQGSLKRYTSGDVPYEFDSGCVLVSATPDTDTPTPQNVTLTVTNDTGKGTIEDDSGAALESGSRAKDTTIKFRITPQEGWEVDSVTVNGTAIQPDNGLYTVTLDKDTEIVVTYKSTGGDTPTPQNVTLTVNDGEHGIVTDENGYDLALEESYNNGFVFKFRVSANAGWTAAVTANSTTLSPDADGLYTAQLDTDTTITVTYSGSAPEPTDPTKGHGELVTDVNDLQDGDRIVIVGENTPKNSDVTSYYALGNKQSKNNNNRPGVEVTLNTDGSVTLNQDVQIIIVHKVGEIYTFEVLSYKDKNDKQQSGGGYYLYAAGTNQAGSTTKFNNYLHTGSTTSINNNYKFSIEIGTDGTATIEAQGDNKANKLRFNYNNGSTLFACYNSGQTAVKIYKFVSEEEPAHEHVWTVGDNAVTWTADVNGATATLTFTCTAEGCTEEGGALTVNIPNDKITSNKKDATCQIEGSVTYSVSLTAEDINGLLDGKGGTVEVTAPVTSTSETFYTNTVGHEVDTEAGLQSDAKGHYYKCKYAYDGCNERLEEKGHEAAEGAEWNYDAEADKHYHDCKYGCGTHVDETAHKAADGAEWKSDDKGHYHDCVYGGCNARVDEAEHQLGTVYTPVNENGKDTHTRQCSECNYVETNDCSSAHGLVSLGADTHAKKCELCNDTISSTVEPHDFSKGACECGQEQSLVTLSWGDSNTHNVNTLADAIQYIKDGDTTGQVTITVHDDRQLPGFTVETSWDIVLDLQGHTYTATSPITVATDATFAVENGTITNSTNFGAAATVAVRRSARTIASDGNVLVDNQGTLTVFANAHIVFNGGSAENTALNNSGEVTLQGTVSSESGTALKNEAQGNVTFSGNEAKATTKNGVALDNSGTLGTTGDNGKVSVEVTGTGEDSSHAVGFKNSADVKDVQVNVTVDAQSQATGVELNGGTFKPSSDSTIGGSVVVDPAEGSDVTATLPDNFNGNVELKGDSTGDVNVTLPKDYQGDVTIDESSHLTCDQIAEGTGTLAHDYTDQQWQPDLDNPGKHYQECARCKAKNEGTCDDNDWASDDTQHWHVCSVCGYEHAKTDHTWSVEWTWEEYTSAKATFTCTDGCGVEIDPIGAEDISGVITTTPTCQENSGEKTYTAKVQFNGKEYTDKKVQKITGNHSYTYLAPGGDLAEKRTELGLTFGKHQRYCSVCGQAEEGAVGDCTIGTTTPNKCDVCGYTYTADEIIEALKKIENSGTYLVNKNAKFELTGTVKHVGGEPCLVVDDLTLQLFDVEYSNGLSESKMFDGVKATVVGPLECYNSSIGTKYEFNGGTVTAIVAPEFDITLKTEGDNITSATVEPKDKAAIGSEVTVSVTVPDGYEAEVVVKQGETTITVTTIGNQFKFTMPNGAVIITVKAFEIEKITITKDSFTDYGYKTTPITVDSITFSRENMGLQDGALQFKASGAGKLFNTLPFKGVVIYVVLEKNNGVSWVVEFANNSDFSNSKSVSIEFDTNESEYKVYSPIDDAKYVRISTAEKSGTPRLTSITYAFSCNHSALATAEFHEANKPCYEGYREGHEQDYHTAYYQCPDCGKYFNSNVVGEAKEINPFEPVPHNQEKIEERKTTDQKDRCTAEVWYELDYLYCPDCGMYSYGTDKTSALFTVIPGEVENKALGHRQDGELQIARWESGEHLHKCSICGADISSESPLDSDMEYASNEDGSTHKAKCNICNWKNDNEDCTAKDGWVSDETGHWHICKYCQGKINSTFGEHTGTDGNCECGYQINFKVGNLQAETGYNSLEQAIAKLGGQSTIYLVNDNITDTSVFAEAITQSFTLDLQNYTLTLSNALTIGSGAIVTIQGTGTLTGDLEVAGKLTISCNVTGKISVSDGEATISGAVTGNVILTGGTLTLNGATVGNINITVTKNTTVELIEEGESNLGTITIAVNDYVEGAKVQDLTVTLLKSQFKSDDAKESNYTIKSESVNCDDLSGVTFDGATKTPISHTYSDETDTICDICGAEKETFYERKEIDELVKTAPTDTETYIVEGIWVHDNSKSELSDDQYGNGFLYDPSSGNRIEHYGMLKDEETFNSAIATWKSKNTFTNPKEFQSFRNQFEEGDKIELGVVYNSKYDNYYSFFIRRTEVKANIDYEATTDFNADGGTVTIDNASKLHYGEEVTINITTQDGYKVGSVKHNDTVINAADGVYKFTVVPGPNKISVNFVEDTVETEKYYVKINATSELVSGGKYLIVYESANIAYDGSNTQKEKSFAVSISSDRIKVDATTADKYFTITLTNTVYTIQSQSGYYIGNTNSTSNQTLWNTTTKYTNNITVSAGDADIQDATVGTKFRVNTKNNNQMRYFKAGTADGNPTQYVLVQLYLLQE